MITSDMLRTDDPPDRTVILALVSDCYYRKDGGNSYLPEWQTMVSNWYLNNRHLYEGWIELEATGRYV